MFSYFADMDESLPLVYKIVVIFINIFNFFTLPLFWLFQRPYVRRSEWQKKRASIEKISRDRIRIRADPIPTKSSEFFDKHQDCSILDYLEWIGTRFCDGRHIMGKRKVLGHQDGFFNGKAVKKVSLSNHFETITANEVISKYQNMTKGMIKMLDLQPGQKVLIFAKTRMEWILSALAVLQTGCTVTTLFTTMSEEAFLYGLNQTKPVVIITEAEWLTKIAKATQVDVPGLKETKIVCLDDVFEEQSDVKVLAMIDLELIGQGKQIELPKVHADDEALLMYTSGTTANAKGVIFTHRQVMTSVKNMSLCASLYFGKPVVSAETSNLSYLPLAHTFGLVNVLVCLGSGGVTHFGSPYTLTNESPLVVPGELGDLMASQPENFTAVPLVLIKMKTGVEKKIREKGEGFESFFKFCVSYKLDWIDRGYTTPILDRVLFERLKASLFGKKLAVLSFGGAKLPPDVTRFFKAILPGVSICNGYGTTESKATGTVQYPPQYNNNSEDVGYTIGDVSLMLESWKEGGYNVDDESGPAGEIIIGGNQLASGYFQHDDPYDNLAFFKDEQGKRWFRTADIGKLNPQTYALNIIDRKKQLVKMLNGEYVSLTRIETALMSSPYIETACVFTRPEKRYIVAIVIAEVENCKKILGCEFDNKTLSEKLLPRLTEELEGTLTNSEIPKAICVVSGPWTPESGLVTGALKTRRPAIGKFYESEISAMFERIN